jgi:predicted Zn-dependent protease
MSKVGRNEPCPCGSGKKYKRCCLERDRVAEVARVQEKQLALRDVMRAMADHLQGDFDDVEETEERADEVQELVEAGQLDDAEQMCRELVAEFPKEPAYVEQLGEIFEARGQERAAAVEYRGAVAIFDELGEGNYCDCCRARMVKAVHRLDPDGPALALGRDPQ